jgi:hypothetical protein
MAFAEIPCGRVLRLIRETLHEDRNVEISFPWSVFYMISCESPTFSAPQSFIPKYQQTKVQLIGISFPPYFFQHELFSDIIYAEYFQILASKGCISSDFLGNILAEETVH